MCGIFGVVVGSEYAVAMPALRGLVSALFLESASRGKEAAGMAVDAQGVIRVDRQPVAGAAFVRTRAYRGLFEQLAVDEADAAVRGPLAVIGHSRLATSGHFGIGANNQPVNTGRTVGVHNGVIANYRALGEARGDLELATSNDSELLFRLLDLHVDSGLSEPEAMARVMDELDGSVTIAALFRNRSSMLLATNHGSLHLCASEAHPLTIFASEEAILTRVQSSRGAEPFLQGAAHRWIEPGELVELGLESGRATVSSLTRQVAPVAEGVDAAPAFPRREPVAVFDRLVEDAAARDDLRRCTRCILPQTMPFIEFDDAGVCNYCRKYRPLQVQGHDRLAEQVERHRRSDGRPECIVGFSGGRDSSYALHYLVREMGLRPLAYTYDWGMVNDLARRNQARLIGQLGVEHVIIADPIQVKLRHIRSNIEAWLRKPDLGMVPIFMAGDKLFFSQLNDLYRRTGIELGIWANNRLEKAEFKLGFAGVYQEDPARHRKQMEITKKLRHGLYYLSRFAGNPAYLNSSLWSTAQGYFSYYFSHQGHLNLFDYVDWDEKEVVDTIRDEYDWETAQDTPSTWRIGDGTAAFYNFIYYTIAGFTENDAFRSNQIRQGALDRETALTCVREENRPRYDTLVEYATLVGVDFNHMVSTIEATPKLYASPSAGPGS